MCHGKLNRCMNDPYNVFEGKLPGQTCDFNYQCLSGACVSSVGGANIDTSNFGDFESSYVCSGLSEGDVCKSDNHCGTGFYCDSTTSKCTQQTISACSRDEECSNNMACSNRHCILYGTLSDFAPADNGLACQSGFVMGDKCVPAPQIVNKQGPEYRCASPTDTCQYQVPNTDFTFETACSCGLNPTGASFCPNIYTPSYTNLLQEVTATLS